MKTLMMTVKVKHKTKIYCCKDTAQNIHRLHLKFSSPLKAASLYIPILHIITDRGYSLQAQESEARKWLTFWGEEDRVPSRDSDSGWQKQIASDSLTVGRGLCW